MVDETVIATHLAAINETFAEASSELPARLERIRSFCGTAVHSVARPSDNTVEAICARIDKERDRRIDGGFEWSGLRFQSRPSDRENFLGAAQLALAAISQGAQPDDYRWANPDADFEWIVADNSKITLDAHQMMALFVAGVSFKQALTFYARELKDAVIEADDPTAVNILTGWPFDPTQHEPEPAL